MSIQQEDKKRRKKKKKPRSYLRVGAVVFHQGMLNLDALLGIARGNSSVDIVEVVNGQVGVELVSLFKLLEMLEMLQARHVSLQWAGNRGDLLRLMAPAEDGRQHCRLVCAK